MEAAVEAEAINDCECGLADFKEAVEVAVVAADEEEVEQVAASPPTSSQPDACALVKKSEEASFSNSSNALMNTPSTVQNYSNVCR